MRLAWDDVAPEVRTAVADLLGAEVVEAVNQPGGYSPGVAARCVLADGRRCFIKAVSSAQNPQSPDFHRREGEVAAALPPGLPVPELLARYDDGDWVVLAFEDVDGHQPRQPWTLDDLAATFAALAQLAEVTTPCPLPGLRDIATGFDDLFRGFRKLAADDTGVTALIDPWAAEHLVGLAAIEAEWAEAAAGSTLLHCDLRADNLLVRPDGSVVVVDWPHAAVGAAWVDILLMLPSVGLAGGPSPSEVERALLPFVGVDPEAVDTMVVALTGYFVHAGTLPDPPGLPTVRAFQRAQGAVALQWVRDRLGQ